MKLGHYQTFILGLVSMLLFSPILFSLYSLQYAFLSERDKVYANSEIEIRDFIYKLKFYVGIGRPIVERLESLNATSFTYANLEEILIVNEEGRTLFSFSGKLGQLPPHLEQKTLAAENEDSISRFFESQQILVHSRLEILNDGKGDLYMVVSLVHQLDDLWLIVFDVNRPLILFLLLYIGLFIYLFVRLMPFIQVAKMAEELSMGNTKANVSSDTAEKFPKLVAALNQMAILLKEKDLARSETEKELQHSQLALREAHRIGGMGSWSQDFVKNEYFWSDQLFEMLGIAPRKVTSEWLGSIVHPDDFHILQHRVSVGDEISEFELRVMGADGEYRYFVTRWESQFDKNGKECKRFGTAQNVTDRRLESIALQSQERTLAEVEEKSHLGNWEWDIKKDLLTWSDETYRIFGYEPNEFKPYQDFFNSAIHPEDRERIKEAMEATFEKGEPYKLEFRIFRPDGHERTILAEAVIESDSTGEPIRWVGTGLDITERKVAESLSYLLTQAIEQAGEAFVITNTEGAFVYVNSSFVRMTGYSEKEALGQTMALLSSGHHDDKFYEQIQSDLQSGNKWTGRIVNRSKDGKILSHETVVSPVFDVNGKVANYVIVIRDVTEELIVQAQLSQAQKMESIGRLAGGVAHDFNNMLTVILGRSELVRNRIDNDSPIFREIDEIIKAAQNSSVITKQLLAFARKDAIKPKYINLNEFIEPTINMLERLIGENILLIWNPGIFEGSAHIDPVQINQILTNLCVNARDAIVNTGSITIETQKVGLDEIEINPIIEAPSSHYLMLSVADTGSGMSESVIENIFEPFFTTKESGEGTGLGLSMVYGMVNQNKGVIKVSSKLEEGTVIQIYLPCFEGVKTDAEKVESASAELTGGETILIIEDNVAVQELAVDMLTSLDYQVLSAVGPETGFKLFKNHVDQIDLVITDVVMPEMNGRELIDKMLVLRPKLNYLFMSGYTQEVINQRGILEEGINFIQKPFRYADFANKVRFALKEH